MTKSLTFDSEIDVSLSEIFERISTEDLAIELERRRLEDNGKKIGKAADKDVVLDNVYYALRDGDVDRVIREINPLLEITIGKTI